MTSLVERLRANAEDYTGELQCEAADTIEALTRSLRHLRAFWMPGSDHDTQEVQIALADADAALERVS